jgi:aquaporin Z
MRQRIPWRPFVAELIGTALLVLVGLSLVIVMFGSGTPMAGLIPSEGLRRLITGFLFGTTGAMIALSAVGKQSGAHINPVVTMAFWLFRKLDSRTAIIYVVAQLAGAILGSLPLLVWGDMGRSVAFGATLPGSGYSIPAVLLGEIVTTFTMVALLIVFVAFRRFRPFSSMTTSVWAWAGANASTRRPFNGSAPQASPSLFSPTASNGV